MTGLLITNKYIHNEKFDVLKNGFINAANDLNVKLDDMNNQMAYELLDKKKKYDFIIFYDKDVKLARLLEEHGYKLYNDSRAISICDDKSLTYIAVGTSVVQPYTIISPFLYYGDLSEDEEFIKKCESSIDYPMIVKESCGSFGMQVYMVKDNLELRKCIKSIGSKSFIVQKFIKTSFGKDIRLQVIGDKVVCAMKRINHEGDFRANVTNGATPYHYIPSERECEMALKVTSKLKIDFAGVDLLIGENDEPIFCEINSNAHLGIISKTSGVNVYNEIITYIVKDMRC